MPEKEKKEQADRQTPTLRKDGTVRAGPLASIPEVLRSFGCDPEPVLSSVGLNPDQFHDPDERISYVTASRMLARCVSATGCEYFGLLVGERAGPSHLGIAGFLVLAAPDVATALRSLLTYLDLHDDGGVLTVETTGASTLLGYTVLQPGAVALDQIYDLSIAVACNIMRALCGVAWIPNLVLLSRRRPRDGTPYRRFFRAPLRFDADRSAVSFPTRWLEHPLTSANSMLYHHLETEARRIHARQRTGRVGELRSLLYQCLMSGQCTANDIARRLSIHERTLNRRLRAEGTSFQRELDGTRFAISCQLLTETNATLTEIAAVLRYADASAFSRAFKRWSDSTPAEWRKRFK